MNKTRTLITAIVTLAVAAISYRHIFAIAHSHGNDIFTSALYPLPIDGVIIASTLTMIQKTGLTKATRTWAKVGRYFGFAATMYANMLHSGWTSTDTVIVNLIPAISLIISVEVLIHAAQGTVATRTRKTTAKSNVTPLRKVK